VTENPETWGPAEKVISSAIDRYESPQWSDLCGVSLERFIADALREAGLLKDGS
jgi:hypothetical protein